MDKTFLQQKIEERAERRLKDECKEIEKVIAKTALGRRIKIGERYLTRLNPDGAWRNPKSSIFDNMGDTDIEGTNMKEVCEKRRGELIQEETERILSNLTDIQYLFKNKEEDDDE